MKTEVAIVDGKMTVMEALTKMKHVETKSLIVEKRNIDDEYGMVLLSDIAKDVLAKDRSPERIKIFENRSKPASNVDPNMDMRYCARLFERYGLARAPGIENKQVSGVISFTDMVLKGLVEFD